MRVALLRRGAVKVLGPTATLLPLFLIFQKREALAYKIIDALLSSTAFNLIHDAYFRLVTKGQLSTIKPNRIIPFDTKFMELFKE